MHSKIHVLWACLCYYLKAISRWRHLHLVRASVDGSPAKPVPLPRGSSICPRFSPSSLHRSEENFPWRFSHANWPIRFKNFRISRLRWGLNYTKGCESERQKVGYFPVLILFKLPANVRVWILKRSIFEKICFLKMVRLGGGGGVYMCHTSILATLSLSLSLARARARAFSGFTGSPACLSSSLKHVHQFWSK